MTQLSLRLSYLPFPETFAGDDGGCRSKRVTWQVNQRGDGEGNKITGDNVGSHTGNKHLRQQLPSIKQHRFNTCRNTNPHHFPDNGKIEWTEITFQCEAQGWCNAGHQYAYDCRRTDVARNGQPKPGSHKTQAVPGKNTID